MKISIVMATWMGEKYLKDQLQSFTEQSRHPDELVVRDDGSTDKTKEILYQFATQAPFKVHILPDGPRFGYTLNFETVLQHATGDLIFLSDQDDIWLSQKLKKILYVALANPDKMLFINDVENVDQSLNLTGISKLKNIRRAGLSENRFITGCATAVRRSLLNFALPFPKGLKSHDHWLHECALLLGARVVVPDVLQLYRRHNTNASKMLVSRPQSINRISASLEALRSDSLKSHRHLLLINNALYGRLKRLNKTTVWMNKNDLGSTISVLEKRLKYLQGRIEILKTGWPERQKKALIFWLRGGYNNFYGWKSLTNDLLRVRSESFDDTYNPT